MEKILYPELERRRWALARRITKLRIKMDHAPPLERIQAIGEVAQLEMRHARLKLRLQRLNARGTGWRQNIEAGYECLAYDIAVAIQDFVIQLDAGRLLKPDHGTVATPLDKAPTR